MWKFTAENIGKVSRAEISMSPLVLLLGKNNTGKSYIATLSWALANLQPLLSRDDARERRPQWFANMRENGIRSLRVSCVDCTHSTALNADGFPEHLAVKSV